MQVGQRSNREGLATRDEVLDRPSFTDTELMAITVLVGNVQQFHPGQVDALRNDLSQAKDNELQMLARSF